HAARPDARAVAHLHAPYATLFAVGQREYRPVLLAARWFAGGLKAYAEPHLITTPERGQRVIELLGADPALLLRAHGLLVAPHTLRRRSRHPRGPPRPPPAPASRPRPGPTPPPAAPRPPGRGPRGPPPPPAPASSGTTSSASKPAGTASPPSASAPSASARRG